jgi:hypothetical protein
MFFHLRALSPAIGLSLSATPAFACPFCDSVVAEQVRAGIFDSDFLYHLAASAAPFPILIGVVAYIYFGGMPSGSTSISESMDANSSVDSSAVNEVKP